MLADTGSVANILISEVFSFIWVLGFKFVKKESAMFLSQQHSLLPFTLQLVT